MYAMFITYGVYVVREAGLDPLQLVLAGTALEAAVFIAEIPTGVVADVYSRRLSMIIGLTVSGVGFALMGASPTFLWIAGGQAVWGVGWTFISGAQQAWLADEVGEADAAPIYLRATQLTQVARLLAIPVGVAIASRSLQLPYFFAAAIHGALVVLLMLTMAERGFAPAARGERSTWSALGSTLRAGLGAVRGRPTLLTILVIAVLYGASSEATDRLGSLLLLDVIGLPDALDEVVWFGVIGAVALLGGIAVTGLAGRAVESGDPRPIVGTLLALTAVLTGASFVFAFTTSIWLAIGAYWVAQWVRIAIDPLTLIWLNRGLDPASRATVLSMLGQSDALGQTAGGPVLGLIGTLRTVRAALTAVGVILLPTLALYARELSRRQPSERPPAS